MMKKAKHKLALDQPATYRIKVPGELDESWSDRAGENLFQKMKVYRF